MKNRLWLMASSVVLVACSRTGRDAPKTLTVYNAAALGPPFRALLDSFAVAHPEVRPQQENGPSLEVVRRVTELGRVPDILAVADQALLPALVVPKYASWYVRFGTNAMVLAYGPRARFAGDMRADNWWQILLRPGVEVGRSDLRVDPSGYRADMVMQLAEGFYRQPGLAQRLRATIPERNVRRAEADLSAHLEAGELDYGWTYESLAIAHHLRYVRLPPEIDLSDPGRAASYSTATVRLPQGQDRPPLILRGEPIVFALTIPTAAPNPRAAEAFVAFLLSREGAAILKRSGFTALTPSLFQGVRPPGLAIP